MSPSAGSWHDETGPAGAAVEQAHKATIARTCETRAMKAATRAARVGAFIRHQGTTEAPRPDNRRGLRPPNITRGKTAAESKTMSGHFLMYLFMGDLTLMVLKCRAIRTTETARMLFYVREKWSVP